MTNTLNKIMHNGDEYLLPEWLPSGWTEGQILMMVSWTPTWVTPEDKGFILWQPYTVDDYTAMQWPCDSGFHIPTKDEWQNLMDTYSTLTWWSTNFKEYFHIPYTWYRSAASGTIYNPSNQEHYWSCTMVSLKPYFYSAFTMRSDYETCSWMCIRPFKDGGVIPDSNWTVVYQGAWDAGVYHNSTLWLISISSDWIDWITIADKNVWATTVWNSWDTLSESNVGKYFQRGNDYGFPYTWSVTTSSTPIDASAYWPWNYYSSSTFITASAWDSSNNYNLWGWETGMVVKTYLLT